MKRRVISIVIVLGLLLSFTTVTAQAATQVEIDQAIQDGLAWLATQQNANGYFGSGYLLANTAAAVLAFENEGHFPGGGTTYSSNVEKGLDYIFAYSYKTAIDNQTVGYAGRNDNPDTNGNGQGVYFYRNSRTYETGMVMQAIADSNTPNRVVTTGGAAGMTYAQVLRDAVDWCAWAQIDGGQDRGGWGYGASDDGSGAGDNSIAQWPVLGLISAEQWGFNAPQWVKDELNFWIDWVQNDASGGSGYGNPNFMVNVAKTGGLLVEMYYYGDDKNTARAQAAISFINNRWNNGISSTWYGNKMHPYAMYAVFKGLELMDVDTIPAAPANTETSAGDWWGDYCEVLVTNQNANGSWAGYSYWTWTMATGWYIIILQATVFPVTVDIDVQEPACNTGYDVDTTYSIERFSANGTLVLYQDGNVAANITLTNFQGTATHTHFVASDSLGAHTWKAVLDVSTGNVTAHAEDTDTTDVVICQPPGPGPIEVGGDVSPVNKLTLLAPWIGLAALIGTGATVAVRRRLTQS